MTAKQQLLERARGWTEGQAQRALDAAEDSVDESGDLDTASDRLLIDASRELEAEEQAAVPARAS